MVYVFTCSGLGGFEFTLYVVGLGLLSFFVLGFWGL